MDLGVGKSRISFPDIEQAIAFAHGKGIVGEHAVTFAMSIFHRRNDDVQRGEGLFQLEPEAAAASRGIERVRSLGHDSFVPCGQSGPKTFLERLTRLAHAFRRHLQLLRLCRRKNLPQSAVPFDERRIQKKLAVVIKKIEQHELHRNFFRQPEIGIPAPQPFLKLREGQRLRSVPSENLAVDDVFTGQCEQRITQFGEFDHFVQRP